MIESLGVPNVILQTTPRLTVGENVDGRIAIAFDVVVPTKPESADPITVRQELLVEDPEAEFLLRALGDIVRSRKMRQS